MASLKRFARCAKPKVEGKEDTTTDGILDLSVTMGYRIADVDKGEMGKLERLMQDYCVAGVVALEQGDLEQHLHFQMVCRARVKSARAFGILCRKYMDCYGKKSMIPAGKVTCKVLTNRLLHTWKGMIGYCLKDSILTHFGVAMHNISDDEVVVGKTLHNIYGKANLKSRVMLTNKNIGERCYVWFKYKENHQLTATMLSTLTDMINLAMFMAVASWITPVTGLGMEMRRMNGFWKCLTDPTNVDRADVVDVFIRKREYVKGRYHDEDVVPLPSMNAQSDYVYEGSPPSSANAEGGGTVSPPSVAHKLPRSLNVPPLSGCVKEEGGEKVSSKNVGMCTKRKLFEETIFIDRPRKSVHFSDSLGDLVPLADIASLPTNTFLPTKEAIVGDRLEKKIATDAEFWAELSNASIDHHVIVAQTKVDVPVKAKEKLVLGNGEGGLTVSRPGWLDEVKESDIVILSSHSEAEDNERAVWPKRTAAVFEDRTDGPSSVYMRGDNIMHVVVKTKPPCDPRHGEDPPYFVGHSSG